MHPIRSIPAAVALLAACRSPAPPPSARPAAPVPACVVPASRDTALVRVAARVVAADSLQPVPRSYERSLLEALRQRLVLPPVLQVDAYEPFARLAGAMAVVREPGVRTISAVVELRAHVRRPLDDVNVVTSSLSPGFDLALMEALARLEDDDVGALPAGRGTARRLRIVMESHLVPDTAATILFEMRSPIVTFDSLVAFAQGNPHPVHPAHLRRRGVEGATTVRFIVDRAGRVVPHSLRVMETDHPDFVDAVAAALLFTRFRPGIVSGCAVPSVAEMTYRFTLR